MKKGLTEVVFILDRSGSMGGLESDTIGGFNGLIEKQKKEEGEALVTTVLFDDQIETIYDRIDVREIPKMTDKEYFVRGCTALLDAIGKSVHHISEVHRYIREEDRPEKTLFVITTDGMENASKEYNYASVKKLIEAKKELGWEFLFLGANMDAVEVAGRFGIDENRAMNYACDSRGTAVNFSALGKAVSGLRRAKSKAAVADAMEVCCAEVRMDYESRK